MKIKNREKLLTIGAIAAVAILAGDRLVYSPLVRTWNDKKIRIAELNRSLTKGEGLLRSERSIRERWDDMKKRSLPADVSKAENDVLQAVVRWQQESQIGLTSIKPQWKRTDEDFATLECRADAGGAAGGSIEAVSRFLYELEKDPLALKIEGVEITSRDTAGQQISLAVRFSGLQLAREER